MRAGTRVVRAVRSSGPGACLKDARARRAGDRPDRADVRRLSRSDGKLITIPIAGSQRRNMK
jgi:hypothetical protein